MRERSKEKGNSALTGIAGVHHVVAELSRRGMVALATVRNTAAYDVLVATPDGAHHANIQVKTSGSARHFFLMPSSGRVRAGDHDHYVLLRWLPAEERYEGFMLSGQEAREEVQRAERFQRARQKTGKRRSQVWPSITVGGREPTPRAVQWRDRWRTWTLE